MNVDALLGFAKLVHRAAKGFEYGDPVRSATATGFVQEHSIRGTLSDGQKVEVPTCVVGDISDGKITGLREYFDTAAGANLRAALVGAYREFVHSLTTPGFLARAAGLGVLVADKGLDVEYRLGEYIGLANQTR